MKKQQPALFSHHEQALEKAYDSCPKCNLSLQIKHSKHGAFLGCISYPQCDYSRPLVEQEQMEQQIISGSECPLCQHELAVKKGRYGIFIGCTNYPQCNHIENSQDSQHINCPICSQGTLVQRVSRYGKTFYACNAYPKCKFAVNHPPLTGICQKCQFPLLVERKVGGTIKRVCADKQCGHKQESDASLN